MRRSLTLVAGFAFPLGVLAALLGPAALAQAPTPGDVVVNEVLSRRVSAFGWLTSGYEFAEGNIY
jgi:hypothetical protein